MWRSVAFALTGSALVYVHGKVHKPLDSEGQITALTFWHGSDDLSDDFTNVPVATSVAGQVHAAALHDDEQNEDPDFYEVRDYQTIAERSFRALQPLCPDVPLRNEPSVMECTGVLVARDVVATAGHCLDDYPCKDMRFVFDFASSSLIKNATAELIQIPKSSVYSCKQLVATEHERYLTGSDWGLVQLDREVGDREPVAVARRDVARGDQIFMISHFFGAPYVLNGHPVSSSSSSNETETEAEVKRDEGPVDITSDGSSMRPHCSWHNECEWTEKSQQECAHALCEASGYSSGVFISASNDPCKDAHTDQRVYFWIMDADVKGRERVGRNAQITATCTERVIWPQEIEENSVIETKPGAFFVATYDNTHGSSGAPVFDAQTQELVGINARGSAVDVVPDEEQWCYTYNQCPNPSSLANGMPQDSTCPGMHATKSTQFAHVLDLYLEGRENISVAPFEVVTNTVALTPNISVPFAVPHEGVPVVVSFRFPPAVPSEEGEVRTLIKFRLDANILHNYPQEVGVLLETPSGQVLSVGHFSEETGRLAFEALAPASPSPPQTEEEGGHLVTLAQTLGVETKISPLDETARWTFIFVDQYPGDAGVVTNLSLTATINTIKGTPVPSEAEGGEENNQTAVEVRASVANTPALPLLIPDASSRSGFISRAENFYQERAVPVFFNVHEALRNHSSLLEIGGAQEDLGVRLGDLSLNVTVSHDHHPDIHGKLIAPSGREVPTGRFPGSTGVQSIVFGRGSRAEKFPLFTAFARSFGEDVEGTRGLWTLVLLDADPTGEGHLMDATLSLFFEHTR
uniref:Peptidase S1 domain-containing protein n=1 Tax=Chromera velia CCMP2878 TaxID=1169474 RepID=A0A0G4HQW7_9ALVE|eukprot:Cvel_8004.t1-p1 / transcript=Cvel_8004.t1 / gene=Cvel_8004 / organism=Chromera_velia_CCMP2878 / gene_product=hypothetical protein / transcript_product=hypothetical protein / location=Cvel_scaffold431:56948-61211(-) / protein_length=805 / sequence_SO=supercontig / SO=protein_coding / is_pseudo=false